MENGDKNIAAWLEPCMFAKENLGNVNEKGLELFWKRLVHKFYRLKALITLEQVNASVVEKKEECSWAKTSNNGADGIEASGQVL